MAAKLTINELKARWETSDGQILIEQILTALKYNSPLASVTRLSKFENRFDLRGISFPKEHTYWLSRRRKLMNQVLKSSKFSKALFQDIDFSYANIEAVEFSICKFSNCIFYQVNARQIRCYDCDFEDTVFKNTRLSFALLNMRKWTSSGSFNRVHFIKTQLSEVRFDFPQFKECLFEDCNLHATNFDGSRFELCKFTGLVDSPWFRKHAIFGYSPNFLINKINRTKYSNEMKNVDFADAILKNVCFTDDLDLSLCVFPPQIEKVRFESYWSDYCINSVEA